MVFPLLLNCPCHFFLLVQQMSHKAVLGYLRVSIAEFVQSPRQAMPAPMIIRDRNVFRSVRAFLGMYRAAVAELVAADAAGGSST
jgi:hypothetical protein